MQQRAALAAARSSSSRGSSASPGRRRCRAACPGSCRRARGRCPRRRRRRGARRPAPRWRPSRSRRRRNARARWPWCGGVISEPRCLSSRLSVSGRMSAKTGRAPRSTKALTVETNVNDGHDHLVARADVEQQRGHLQGVGAGGRQQDLRHAERVLEQRVALLGEGPSPERWPAARTSRRWSCVRSGTNGRLNGIVCIAIILYKKTNKPRAGALMRTGTGIAAAAGAIPSTRRPRHP